MSREEEIKKEAARENKNTENAIIDEGNLGLIDIDDILAEDNPVTRKIKNLFDYGVTEEQIKTLFNSISDISTGASFDEALETLNQIFVVLASKITNSPDVPLVIDLATGEKDEVLTEIQAVELGISYDYITGTTIEIKNEAMLKIVSSLNLEEDFNIKPQVSIYSQITKGLSLESDLEAAKADMDFFKKSFEMDFSSPIPNFDLKSLGGIDKNVEENIELDMPSMMLDSYISEEADTYFIEYLYKYMRHNPDIPETVEYSQRKLLRDLENRISNRV